MMLEWLGEDEKAAAVEDAVAAVVREGRVRTYDMGGGASTLQMAQAIAGVLGGARRATALAGARREDA
jgi:3-isopropylmalate dehydrogenase